MSPQISWETGGQDWVDELKDDEYKMAKPPAPKAPNIAPAPAPQPQKRKRSVKEAKILVYGLAGAGKTSIINRLANTDREEVKPTAMFDVQRFTWSDVKLTVFDFGGAHVLLARSCAR
eukprot:SAG11_NODE_459_length_9261_cov_7.747463_14_plen_118_part_00